MNVNVIGETALVVAALCEGCLVLAVSTVGVAALRGRGGTMLRATVCAVAVASLALIAFAVLGTIALDYTVGG